jgi:beta-1,4-mannosyltransferase
MKYDSNGKKMDVLNCNAYIYPYSSRGSGMTNPYIGYFINSLEDRIKFVNKEHPSNSGIFDLLKYLHQIDILFLNWPEEILEKKGGLLQSLLFMLIIPYLKLKKVKIFFTFHNKESHIKNKIRLKNCLRNFTARRSDYILTHAQEGVEIVKKLAYPGHPKILFLHHPVLSAIKGINSTEKVYDILIWGMVIPYKGIDQFLNFIRHEKLDHLKILVAGKIAGKEYRDKILSFQSDQIEIRDKFLSDDELEVFISKSRAVLFTYLEYSILSSGALMDTLRYAPLVIGPDFGAFKDLHDEGLILTYKDLPHLKILLENHLQDHPDTEKINQFISANSWKGFGIALFDFINSN